MTTKGDSRPLWRMIVTGLNILALALSAIMSWHYLAGGQIAGCGGGSPCEQVLSSRWSSIAGIVPVSGLAVGAYLAFLVASLFIGSGNEIPIRRLAWSVMLIITGSVTGSAIWFTILQKWVIGDFCPYCMTTHITGLLLSALVVWRAVKDSPEQALSPFQITGRVLAGLVLAGVLILLQSGFNRSTVYSGERSQEKIPAIDYHSVPLMGSPDSPYVVSLLFDYQCSHCQKIHFMLDEAIERCNGKLAFVLCPAPLDSRCNPYVPGDADQFKNSCGLAKIALAVWVADHKLFSDFENWMFTYETGDRWTPRSMESARIKAVELVGQPEFEEALKDPWIEKYLEKTTWIYGQTISEGRGGVPKMIFGSRWVIPQPSDTDDLIRILQENLGLPE